MTQHMTVAEHLESGRGASGLGFRDEHPRPTRSLTGRFCVRPQARAEWISRCRMTACAKSVANEGRGEAGVRCRS